MNWFTILIPLSKNKPFGKFDKIFRNTVFYPLASLQSMKRIVILNESNLHVMIKVNFTLHIKHNTSIPLPCIKCNKSFSHMNIKLISDISNIQISINFKFMSDFTNLSHSKLNRNINIRWHKFRFLLITTSFLKLLIHKYKVVLIVLKAKILKLVGN